MIARAGWPTADDLAQCVPLEIEKPIMITIDGEAHPLSLHTVECDGSDNVKRFTGRLYIGMTVLHFDSGEIAEEHRLPRANYPLVRSCTGA